MKSPMPLPKADDNVVLPRAVRAAAQRSEDIAAQITAAGADTTQPAADPAPTPQPEPQSSAPVPPAPVETPAPAPAPSSGDPGSDNWEHKYNSLKGRYDRQSVQLSDLQTNVANLQQLIGTLQRPTEQTPTPTPKPPRTRQVTEQEETEYGTEFLGVVGKRARDEIAPEIEELREQLANIGRTVQGVTQVTAQTAREKMHVALDEQLPTWKVINTRPEFLQWLALPDVMSGVTRMTLLTQAYEQNQVARVLAFFNGFLSEEAATAPQVTQPTTPAPAPSPSDKVPLENFAAPGRAKTPAVPEPPVPGEKPIISPAQISQFYLDVAKGMYRGKDDEKNRVEAMIFDAQKDGRVR